MRWIVCLTLALVISGEAAAEDRTRAQAIPASVQALLDAGAGNELLLALAKDLIRAGRLDEAIAHLDQVEVTPENAIDVAFLRGTIAEIKGDLPAAVRYFRYILGRRPDLVRVRLELARVLFLLGKDDAARHHFELARGADPPANVVKNIERFLDAIRNRRRVHYNFSIAIAPDTNINAAPEASQVDIFGIPSELTEDARRTSGLGLATRGGVDVRHPLARGIDAETGVAARHLDYSNDDFDDTGIWVYGGARRFFAATDVGVRATASRRWFAGAGYSYGVGGRLDVGHRVAPRWFARVTLSGAENRYDVSEFLDGPIFTAQAEVSHALSADSRLYVAAGVTREVTDDPAYTNTSPFIGLGYEKEFMGRLRVAVEPAYTRRRFDDDLDAFARRRRDSVWRFRTRVTYRKDMLFGFAPFASYTFTYNGSNVTIYDYNRHQFEFGLTRRF